MTAKEKQAILERIRWCIDRIREQESRRGLGQETRYEALARDVYQRLCFLADWINNETTLEKEP